MPISYTAVKGFLIMTILLCATILDSQQRFLINDDPSKYIDLGGFTTR